MGILTWLLTFVVLIASSSCDILGKRWCNDIKTLDCNQPPHNELVYLCGTDGKTYDSRCSLNQMACAKNVAMVHVGKCKERFEKIVCEYIDHIICHGIDPVCGTDNQSYDNGCELVKAHCKDNTILEAYTGFCSTITTQQPVTMDPFCQSMMKTACHGVNPICGMDNVTYDNDCEFEKVKCTNPDLHIKKMGVC